MTWEVACSDVLDWAAEYGGPKFHAVLCDPPYELSFMGKQWDASGVAFQKKTWEAITAHLHPGGFVMAFGGSRTVHRLMVAMEDAGLVIHPAIGWVNGQGFPKATRIDTQVDRRGGTTVGWFGPWLREWRQKRGISQRRLCEKFGLYGNVNHGGIVSNWELGLSMPSNDQFNVLVEELSLPFGTIEEARREVIGQQTKARKADSAIPLPTTGKTEYQTWDITAPATLLAQAWAGHRYGLQALKPALEFVCVAQKPYGGKPVDSITETGAGALWIDGGRVGTNDNCSRQPSPLKPGAIGYLRDDVPLYGGRGHSSGRWPPNFALCHLPACKRIGTREGEGYSINRFTDGMKPFGNGAGHPYESEEVRETVAAYHCAPGCPVVLLGEQSGVRKTTWIDPSHANRRSGEFMGALGHPQQQGFNDTGTAARFFFQADWQHEVIEQVAGAAPFLYKAKAGRKERDAGLEGMAEQIVHKFGHGNSETDPFTAAHQPIYRNPHPTVKPIALCRWLATLLLPPAEYAPRRIAIPFGGSGSEGIGAGLAGWDEIVLIETEREYCDIAEARLPHWLDNPQQMGLGL